MKFLALLSLFAVVVAHAAKPKPPAGFIALFNGKNLDGWWGLKTEDPAKWMALSPDKFAAKKKASILDIHKHWTVEDGVLVRAHPEIFEFSGVRTRTDRPQWRS